VKKGSVGLAQNAFEVTVNPGIPGFAVLGRSSVSVG